MDYKKRINEYLHESGGIITSKDCRVCEIPSVYLTRMERNNELTKVDRGIYIDSSGDYDELFFLQYKYKKIIYSYETALFLMDISDKFAGKIEVSVPYSYKVNNPKNMNINYVSDELHNIGVVETKTSYGNKVKIYGFERTLCDFVKNEKNMDREVYIKMLKAYGKYKDKDLNKLYIISKKMGIADKVRNIVELLI